MRVRHKHIGSSMKHVRNIQVPADRIGNPLNKSHAADSPRFVLDMQRCFHDDRMHLPRCNPGDLSHLSH